MSRRHHCWLFFLGLSLVVGRGAAQPPSGNQLADHPSPYLAAHGGDPVHWQVWNKATLDKAVRLNRPILVSIGYFSCHWCHVMQRESFQDADLAKLLNRHFIAVKVDRELSPALDAHLIEFVELTRGQAGWPLNVILTPDGYPMLGTTYLPLERFYQLLTRLAQRWQDDEQALRQSADGLMQRWRNLRQVRSDGGKAVAAPAKRFLRQAEQIGDELAGGFGQQNKFPMVAQLLAMLQVGRPESDAFIRLTLDQMASQGLHDRIGGGFFRYVIDPAWQVPHYEKMLYDNAQLALLYFRAARVYASDEYLAVAQSTLAFMLRELRRGVAFQSSLSAVDSQGREGYYYQWSDDQLEQVLDDRQLRVVTAAWFGDRAAESEYGRLPRLQLQGEPLAERLGISVEMLNDTLAEARQRLQVVRAKRDLPVDSKILAAWNGLALSALAEGYAVTGDSEYRRHAERLARYLADTLWDGKRLWRSRDDNATPVAATLEDYAWVAQGLWDWCRRNPHSGADCASLSAQLVRTSWARYFAAGRWRLDDAPLIPMLEGRAASADGALPSATAVISRLSGEIPALRRDEQIQAQLAQHLQTVAGTFGGDLFWYASYVELLAQVQR